MATPLPSACRQLLSTQHGVIARWQAPQTGLDTQTIDSQLRRDRWQVLYRGVYAAYTGQPPRSALLWAAVLRAGSEAALSYQTAAELDKLTDMPSDAIHVTVRSSRRVSISHGEAGKPIPAIIVHYSARIADARHPSKRPPRTRVEETTLDLAESAANLDEALAWLARACSRRLTTAALLRTAMTARPKLRWRAELTGALTQTGSGVHSGLEWRYVRLVERPHGLPHPTRQARSQIGTRTRYFDNHYRDFGVAIELDGKAAHPPEARWRDIHRDNASATAGIVTLRYSWTDITVNPCRVAAEIAGVLRKHGWNGELRPCGPHCPAALP